MFLLKVFVTAWLCVYFNTQAIAKSDVSKSQSSQAGIQFSKGTVKIGRHLIDVEIAKTPAEHAQGLMYRQSLGTDSGMLFIFSEARDLSFWMKNTFIPLSIAYIDENKKIIDIQDMRPVKSVMEQNPPSYPSSGPAKYALEVNQGFFKKRGIKVGDKIQFSETKVQK